MTNQIKVGSATRESLVGSDVGKDIFADTLVAWRESLIGDSYGVDHPTDTCVAWRETLIGDSVGIDAPGVLGHGSILTVVREVLAREAPVRTLSVSREALVSLPGDPLYVSHNDVMLKQTAMLAKPGWPLPSTVRGYDFAATLREQVAMHRSPTTTPRSSDYAQTMRMQVVTYRALPTADLVRSAISNKTCRQLVAMSRSQAFVAVSMDYARQLRQIAVSARSTLAPSITWSNLIIKRQAELVVLSRIAPIVIITTTAFDSTLAQQAVQRAERDMPRGDVVSAELAQMTVLARDTDPPAIDADVGTLFEQVVQHRVMPDVPVTADVAKYAAMTVLHRATIDPAHILGWRVPQLRQQTLMHRDTTPAGTGPGTVWSAIAVPQLRVSYTLGRTVPAPIDVIDPAIGRHVAKLSMISVATRSTTTPDVIVRQSRYVFQVATQVVLIDDTFEPPPPPPPFAEVYSVVASSVMNDTEGWSPVSLAKVEQVIESVAMRDDYAWPDATIPASEAIVNQVVETAVVGDVFPDPGVAQSDAMVQALTQAVLLGDADFPDPAIVQSDATVSSLAQSAVLADSDFPTADVPQSDVAVSSLAASTVLHDAALTDVFGMSEITANALIHVIVLRDSTMMRIPKRPIGPRPQITVSIS